VTDPEPLDLAKQRGVSELLGDALRIYRANFLKIFAIALAIVVPVELIVSGIGLEELTSGYRAEETTATLSIPVLVGVLVEAPLIAAAMIHILQALSNDAPPRFRQSIQLALDAFAPLFLAVLLAAAAVALGLTLLVIPGIYVAIRLVFVPQSVVVDGKRGPEALRASWALTQNRWWRTFTVILVVNLVTLIPAGIVVAPLELAAESADTQAISLAGMILTNALAAPFVALVSTLLFFDLRSQR
jgi:hypothetical protein